MTFPQAILVAILAGISSALLSGFLLPKMAFLALLLFFFAPVPLMVAGMAMRPGVAALGGLIGCILISITSNSYLALVYGSMIALPSWLLSGFAPGFMRFEQTHIKNPSLPSQSQGVLLCAVALYATLTTFISALTITTSYPELIASIGKAAEHALRMTMNIPEGTLKLPNGMDLAPVITLYTKLALPVSALMLMFVLCLSLAIALGLTDKLKLLSCFKPDIALLTLPKQAILVLALAMMMSFFTGWLSLFFAILATCFALAFVFNGFATAHYFLRGKPTARFTLPAIWFACLVFGFPTIVILLIGLADHAFNLRKLSRDPLTPF